MSQCTLQTQPLNTDLDGSIESLLAVARPRVIDLSDRRRRNDEAGKRRSRQRREVNVGPDMSKQVTTVNDEVPALHL